MSFEQTIQVDDERGGLEAVAQVSVISPDGDPGDLNAQFEKILHEHARAGYLLHSFELTSAGTTVRSELGTERPAIRHLVVAVFRRVSEPPRHRAATSAAVLHRSPPRLDRAARPGLPAVERRGIRPGCPS